MSFTKLSRHLVAMSGLVLSAAPIALGEDVSLAQCAALYDRYDSYVVNEEFTESPVMLPVDYDLRAIAARKRAEQLGEPVEWKDAALLAPASPTEFFFKSTTLDNCDERMGFVPDTDGGKMFGRGDGESFSRPDNLACSATLLAASLSFDQEADADMITLIEEHLNSTFAPLAMVGINGDDALEMVLAAFDRWMIRNDETLDENPAGKLEGENDINTFTKQCLASYPRHDVDPFTVEIGERETYCFRERQQGRKCDDAISAAMAPSNSAE